MKRDGLCIELTAEPSFSGCQLGVSQIGTIHGNNHVAMSVCDSFLEQLSQQTRLCDYFEDTAQAKENL